jgi:hypothetical protein
MTAWTGGAERLLPVGHDPSGFRRWRRRPHGSDDQLDDTHLMRMAGRFAWRVKAWAAANDVPVIFCKAGERKHLIAEQYLKVAAMVTVTSYRLGDSVLSAP